MKNLTLSFLLLFVFSLGCRQLSEIETMGIVYQSFKDYRSLRRVLDLMPPDADTTFVQDILGTPIDFGFDYRYLIDSLGPNGCPVGAVFHIDDSGKIDQQWIGEICE